MLMAPKTLPAYFFFLGSCLVSSVFYSLFFACCNKTLDFFSYKEREFYRKTVITFTKKLIIQWQQKNSSSDRKGSSYRG